MFMCHVTVGSHKCWSLASNAIWQKNRLCVTKKPQSMTVKVYENRGFLVRAISVGASIA